VTDSRVSSGQEEAARWFAASRRGVMTIEERAAYAAWRSDAANAAAIAEFQRVWDALELVRDRYSEGVIEGAAAPRTRRRFDRPALVAAMCAVSLVIGVLSYSGGTPFWTALDWTDR
jgi:ferric-dicitrate binding protein FerR (iron transport regulator)